MTAPHISVLLPCRDAGATLDEAMASLLGQTYSNLEVIGVNDGSSDTTGARLRVWASRDDRVTVIDTKPRGIVAALNRAAAGARGALLFRMDADDVSHATRFERQVDFLTQNSDVAACGTLVRYEPRHLVQAGARRYEAWINSVRSPDAIERDMFVECPIPHPTLAVRRAAFESVGGYRHRSWPEDYDLVLRLWAAGFSLGKVGESLLEWREGPTRLSRVHPTYAEDAFVRCKAHYIHHRLAGRDVLIWGAGPVGKAFARALQDVGHTIVAFVDLDPRKIGQVIHGAPVISPAGVSALPEAYILAAVGQRRARDKIRKTLYAMGRAEPREFCAVA